MRRIIAYGIDLLAIAILSSFAVLVGELAGVDLSFSLWVLVISVLYIGLFPLLRNGATPGLFVVSLAISKLDGTSATPYQLLLRAAVLIFLLPAVLFIDEFVFEYLLQMNLGNLIGWFAIAICLLLTSVPFLVTRSAMGLHDHVAGTCVVSKRGGTGETVRPMKRLDSLILVCVGFTVLAGAGAKIYAPSILEGLQRTEVPELLKASEDLGREFTVESKDLIDGLDRPFEYYADLHGFHGLRSWEIFSTGLKRKGLLGYVPSHGELPVYSVMLTTRGQLNLAAQDVLTENLIRFLRPRGYNACTIEFVSRTDLLGLLTLRVTRRVVAIDILRSLSADKAQMVVVVDSPHLNVQLMSPDLSEEMVQMTQTR
jgi:uncharacterized RDD family membrane protein YckC